MSSLSWHEIRDRCLQLPLWFRCLVSTLISIGQLLYVMWCIRRRRLPCFCTLFGFVFCLQPTTGDSLSHRTLLLRWELLAAAQASMLFPSLCLLAWVCGGGWGYSATDLSTPNVHSFCVHGSLKAVVYMFTLVGCIFALGFFDVARVVLEHVKYSRSLRHMERAMDKRTETRTTLEADHNKLHQIVQEQTLLIIPGNTEAPPGTLESSAHDPGRKTGFDTGLCSLCLCPVAPVEGCLLPDFIGNQRASEFAWHCQTSTQLRKMKGCGHQFHSMCLTQWLQNKGCRDPEDGTEVGGPFKCPLCGYCPEALRPSYEPCSASASPAAVRSPQIPGRAN